MLFPHFMLKVFTFFALFLEFNFLHKTSRSRSASPHSYNAHEIQAQPLRLRAVLVIFIFLWKSVCNKLKQCRNQGRFFCKLGKSKNKTTIPLFPKPSVWKQFCSHVHGLFLFTQNSREDKVWETKQQSCLQFSSLNTSCAILAPILIPVTPNRAQTSSLSAATHYPSDRQELLNLPVNCLNLLE